MGLYHRIVGAISKFISKAYLGYKLEDCGGHKLGGYYIRIMVYKL